MADTIRTSYYEIAESTFGTTPTSPSFDKTRFTDGQTINLTKSEIQSGEIYSDGMERISRHGNRVVSGTLPFEWSYGTYDKWMKSLLMSAYGTGVTITATDISAVNSTNTLSSAGSGFGSFTAGMIVNVSSTDNSGMGVIVSVDADDMVLAGITLVDDSAGDSVTITQYNTIIPSSTRSSISLLEELPDITERYSIYTGIEPSAFNISIQPDAVITGSFTLSGKDTTFPSASTPSGSILGSVTTTKIQDSFTGSFLENYAGVEVTGLDLTIENARNPKFVLFQNTTNQPSRGRVIVTGTISMFFDNISIYTKFLNETESSVLAATTDPDGNKEVWYLPKIKYNSFDKTFEQDGAITASASIRAIYDTTSGTSFAHGKLDA